MLFFLAIQHGDPVTSLPREEEARADYDRYVRALEQDCREDHKKLLTTSAYQSRFNAVLGYLNNRHVYRLHWFAVGGLNQSC